jgi:hypothetical protein
MLRDEIFRIWAPPSSVWSPWVKPVLFSHMDPVLPDATLETVDIAWADAADGSTAMVLDLPCASGISMGIALMKLGYRPIPLYNACPEDFGKPSLVEVRPILSGLSSAAKLLRDLSLADDAPPIFLLDANRRSQMIEPAPGVLDNRSISLPTDFPSGQMLLSRGIRRVLLVQDSSKPPQADLSHTLCRWQDAGIEIHAKDLSVIAKPRLITVNRPGGFRVLWHNFLATVGLKTSPLGGFGGVLPFPSGG